METESKIFIAIPFYADSWQAGQRRMPTIAYKRVVTAMRVYRERQGRGMSVKGNAIEALNKDRALRNPIIDWSKVSQLAPRTKEKPIGKLLCRKYLQLSNWWIECVLIFVLFVLLLNAACHTNTRVAVACNINYNVVIESWLLDN